MSQATPQKIAIPTPLFQQIAKYLESRVYSEVASMLNAVAATMEVIEPVVVEEPVVAKKKKKSP